ncbi:MAG: hypothetical protein QGI21_01810 [Candidatus Poseidoniaceae archaeon]|jgi:murein DD-endopeptidase MepM/ murein hydrolase activator NlpD|nr:hypothetical protein [Candidatus Poseidoniaceae archaeon]
MFGAADPHQAIQQLEAYHSEGRSERAEVMASALVDQLMATKKRDDETQLILVKGIRILAKVLNSRGKKKRARTTIKVLHKERNRLGKKIGLDLEEASEDYRLAGFIHANAGKNGAAKRAFSKAERCLPGHLASALDMAEQCGATKILRKLYPRAGSVISKNGTYVLEIEGRPAADAVRVGMALGGDIEAEINSQIAAIAAGEQAANVKLQAAMDSLVPTHDYHSYSTN